MTRDRWPDLQASLPRHEAPVILVDNGSSDGTPDVVRRHFPHVDVVELGGNHGSVARNIGVERARTPYVAFADDDSWWAPGALEAAADTLDAHPRLAVLAGRLLVGADERHDPVCALMADSPLGRAADLPGPSVLGFLACGAVVRRDAYLAAGGFDDVVFFIRTNTAAAATVRIDACQVNVGSTANAFIEAPTRGQLTPGRPVVLHATWAATDRPKFFAHIQQLYGLG